MDRIDKELNAAARELVKLTQIDVGGRFTGGLESGPPPIFWLPDESKPSVPDRRLASNGRTNS